MCCWIVSLACFSARWNDDAWKLLRHMSCPSIWIGYDLHDPHESTSFPFTSFKIHHIAGSQILSYLGGGYWSQWFVRQGGIFDMAGRTKMTSIWILWWLILKSKVFWRSLEFKGVLKTHVIWLNEHGARWSGQAVRGVSTHQKCEPQLEFAASTICLWKHGFWPSKLWKKSLKHLGNYETWAPCVMCKLQDDISTKATSMSLHRNKKSAAPWPTSGSSNGHDVRRIFNTYPLDWQSCHLRSLKWRLIRRSCLWLLCLKMVCLLAIHFNIRKATNKGQRFLQRVLHQSVTYCQLLCNPPFQAGIESLPPQKRYQ